MIELIQSIFSVGDYIKIFFNNSNKSVEGYIFKLLPTSIAIKTIDGKLCGIKGDDIDSFEEGTITNVNNLDTTELVVPTSTSNDLLEKSNDTDRDVEKLKRVDSEDCAPEESHKGNSSVSKTVEGPGYDFITNNELSVKEEENNVSSFKVGDVIPLDVLHQIDPKLKKRNVLSTKNKGGKMKVIGNNLGDLFDLVKESHEIDNLKIVPALGEIKVIRPEMNFGFIRDGKTGSDLYFKYTQIIDKDINANHSVRVPVVYSIQTAPMGPVANSIHTPKSIKEMIDLAHELSAHGEYKHAFNIAEQILAEYPDNFSADSLKRELIKRFPHYSITYNKAKKYHADKLYDKAIEYYLITIENNEKVESAVKDLGMLYAQLAKSEESEVKAEEFRKRAILFMKEYVNKLSNNISTLYYLENFYYSIKEYNQFIQTVDYLLDRRELQHDKKRISQLLCKKAVAYIQIEDIEEAISIVEEALSYDPNNTSALKLKTAIDTNESQSDIIKVISSAEFESLNSGLSSFIQQTLDEYDEYAGVKTKDIESRNFTSTTLKDVRMVIEKAGSSRARERAAYLLTEGKLMQKIEPSEELKLRTVMARYCNAMALSNISDNSSMDVIRFFYNEAFTLEESWESNVRQINLYLLTHKHSYSELISDSTKNNLIENTLDLLLKDGYENRVWDSILTMMLNNTSISAQITVRLFEKNNWRKQAIEALKYFGVEVNNEKAVTQTIFIELWNRARELRLREYQKTITSIKIIGNSNSVEELIHKLYEMNNSIEEWMCPLDKRRIHDIVNSIAPAIDSYIKSSGYRNKDTNKSNANGLIQQLIDSIKDGPTKISYDAILPVMERVQRLLLESFADVVKMSEPKLIMQLLAPENIVNSDRIVPIQISVANHRDSSPIREVSVIIENTEDVCLVQADNTAYNAIDGGENIIFKIKVKVSEKVIENKATVITALCKYKSGDLQKEYKCQMSLRLYSSEEFTPIANPYAPVADGGPVPVGSNMFYGREEFINNIVDAIIKSPSKQVIIYGQKRCGKSSVLLHLRKRLNDTGRAFCVCFSLGDIMNNLSEVSFYHKILDTIVDEIEYGDYDNVPEFLCPKVNEFKAEDPDNPLNTFAKYMTKFKAACKKTPGWENKNLVVMIDEFTYLYSGIKHGNVSSSIMKQWKAITQNERAQFSVVLVGQDVVPSFKKEDYASNAFGVIEDIRLTYLKEEPARELIEKPILNEKGESRYIGNAVSRIIDYTSKNPYYIQIFCDRLVDIMNRNKAISVTEADVNDVARTFIEGSDALPEDKFDNLIRAGESEDLQEYSEKHILAVLKQIAICSKNIGYCNRNDVRVLEDKEEEDAIFKHLYDREVLEQKGDNNYKIQVKLFQEWLLNH